MKCSKCGYDIYEGTTCPLCGYENGKNSTSQPINNGDTSYATNNESEVTIESQYPMKWYKALLVILWIGIIGNVISAITYFSGGIYQGFADKIYEMLPSLKGVDAFSGIFSLAMVVFTFIVWRALKNYKKSAPKLLTIMYVLNTIFLIVYTIAFYSIIGGAETTIIYGDSYISGMYQYQEYLDLSAIAFSASDVISIIGSIVMTIANHIYFRNRAELFKY